MRARMTRGTAVVMGVTNRPVPGVASHRHRAAASGSRTTARSSPCQARVPPRHLAAGPPQNGRCRRARPMWVPVRWQGAARSAGVLAAGRWQGNGQLPEQLLAADRLAVGDGECVDGGEGVVDHDGHGAEDEPFVAVAVGADEIDDAAQVSGPLAADDLQRGPGRVGEPGVQVTGHAVLTWSAAWLAERARPAVPLTVSATRRWAMHAQSAWLLVTA